MPLQYPFIARIPRVKYELKKLAKQRVHHMQPAHPSPDYRVGIPAIEKMS